MCLKKMNKLRDTLSFHLTIWYAVIFTLTSLVALSIFYYRISTVTMAHTDEELREDAQEFAIAMDEGGRDRVYAQLEEEAKEEGSSVFFRLLTSDGRILKSFYPQAFEPVEVTGNALTSAKNRQGAATKRSYVLETVSAPGQDHEYRTIYAALGPDLLLNVGVSLADNYEFLSVFRNLIVLLIFPLFLLAAIIGWFLARHAMKGVQEVTRTADAISKGSIEKRVEVKRKRFQEIDQLTNTFNHMLDRIAALIQSTREMNDNIAHDLRSPLTRIRGVAEMTLIRKSSSDDYREMAANTIEECDNLIGIINTMLEITETESGVQSIEKHRIDLAGLILSACELFEPVAQEKDIRLFTVLPETLSFQSDKNRLQRLITNLLENAIKYNRPGGTVTITAKETENRVHVRVDDTGFGIPEEDLSKIFERFYRCNGHRSEPGTGLGLCLAKAIAQSLDGDITVESRIEQGSSFFVTLPE